jgi:hypothetical protein
MKPKFIDIPTEQTTSVTDVLMAALAAGIGLYLMPLAQTFRGMLWLWVLALVAASSVLGAAAHGFQMAEKTRRMVWHPINLILGLTIALFAAGVTLDLWGESLARTLLPIYLVIGGIFFLVTVFVPGTFLIFIIYEAIAMLFALAGYSWLALGGTLPGAGWMAFGVLVMIVAAAIQATKKARFTYIWQFDHNSVFHFVQMAGIILLGIGLAQGM